MPYGPKKNLTGGYNGMRLKSTPSPRPVVQETEKAAEQQQDGLTTIQVQILFTPPKAKKLDGLVYTVTSPIVDLVMIGMWKGSVKKLDERIAEYYGSPLILQCFCSKDCKKLSLIMRKHLSKYLLGGRLFRKDKQDMYPFAIETLCYNVEGV
jgi:hypothetical protein